MAKKSLAAGGLLLIVSLLLWARPTPGQYDQPGPVQLDANGEAWAQKTLKRLTLEEKVGQMLVVLARTQFFNQENSEYQRLLETIRKGGKPYHADLLKNEHKETQAWAAYAEGKSEDAIRMMREVADTQDKVGKGETESPAREMLADMLLEMNRPKEALAEYEVALKTDPNRFNELNGAAQAAEKLDQKEKAGQYYAQLLKNCQGIDSDRPELAKAKTLVAAK